MNLPNWNTSFILADQLANSAQSQALVKLLYQCIRDYSSIFVLGDGIYSGIASTLSEDFSARLSISGYSPRIFSPYSNSVFLSSVSTLSDIDLSYLLYLRNHHTQKNCIIYLSDSGNSYNLIRVSQMFNKFTDGSEFLSFNISGLSGGALSKVCDHSFILNNISSEALPSHQFYLLSMILYKTSLLLSDPLVSSPPFDPIDFNKEYIRNNLNRIA